MDKYSTDQDVNLEPSEFAAKLVAEFRKNRAKNRAKNIRKRVLSKGINITVEQVEAVLKELYTDGSNEEMTYE